MTNKTPTSSDLYDLEAYARTFGLEWTIVYGTVPGLLTTHREPCAYRLAREAGVDLEPFQVIGETVEQARDTISLAAEMQRRSAKR